MTNGIDNRLERLVRRVQMVIGRARVNTVDDSGSVQRAQVDLGPHGSDGPRALRDGTPILKHFGFSSHPPAGSDAVCLFVGGDRSNGVVIATGHQPSRMKDLSPGDAAIHDDRDQHMWLTSDGIHMTGSSLTIEAGGCVLVMRDGVITLVGDEIVTDGVTRLNKGTRGVAYRGAIDTAGDAIAEGADDVYV